ncbi:MAG: leucyl aminopeptidase [Pseudoprimorskyibacter sp.]|nr:leucyl aminopeptidase [Pseudoprimorskyibacter sp.]
MTEFREIRFEPIDLNTVSTHSGHLAVFVDTSDDAQGQSGIVQRIDRLTRGLIERAAQSVAWNKLADGECLRLNSPAGVNAEAIHLMRLPRRASRDLARQAGAALARSVGDAELTVLAGRQRNIAEIAFGLMLRSYAFTDHKTADQDDSGAFTLMVDNVDSAVSKFIPLAAVAEGVFFTRDLTNEPANVLTTTEFANRLKSLEEAGLAVEIIDEDQMATLGMNALLCVGQGSVAPSKMVVMRWNGGVEGEAPLALVGKGVVFDTGGISLKPAGGMEEMTMDMGGAGVVAGTMLTLARRGAAANVVGLVGLVENMPSGNATRPGDVVTSMKGDTIEVINTDAEGRLVLADVLWYAQETFAPAAVVDLATLTGACIIALGHENAAVFSNDDVFANALLRAAEREQEGAWRMPLGKSYDDLLKSPIADMKNIGGRPAGAITAAQFLQRFVKNDVPWAHIDIAGVARVPKDLPLSPKGCTGWGVMTLNRLVAERFETEED